MITIYGVPVSVHTRKAIVTSIVKGIDYRLDPVIPFDPPANWSALSPTGLIPVLDDDGYVLADSTAICQYLERKHPSPPILPGDAEDCGRALWFDGYAGGTLFRHVVHGLFFQKVIRPGILKEATDASAVDTILSTAQPKIFRYLDSQAGGKFLVGDALSLADIGVVSNLINYQYLGLPIDAGLYPRLAEYVGRVLRLDVFRRALAAERPFVERMGLDPSFLAEPSGA
jgi:glutathione S-transferase